MLVKVYNLHTKRSAIIDTDGMVAKQEKDLEWTATLPSGEFVIMTNEDMERVFAIAGGTMYVSPHHVIIDRRMMGTIMNYLAQLRDMNSRWATEADSKPIHDILSNQAVELSRIVAKIEEALDAQNHSSNR